MSPLELPHAAEIIAAENRNRHAKAFAPLPEPLMHALSFFDIDQCATPSIQTAATNPVQLPLKLMLVTDDVEHSKVEA